jgi:SpoU rRNA methylase family enzyme
MGAKDTGVLADLSEALNRLSNQQSIAIQSGSLSAKQIAHADIIEGELDE